MWGRCLYKKQQLDRRGFVLVWAALTEIAAVFAAPSTLPTGRWLPPIENEQLVARSAANNTEHSNARLPIWL
ncbi:MAG: hypothetical protein ACI91B_003814 [Planctomycetota bacterium]|jgi:hypothetical protein